MMFFGKIKRLFKKKRSLLELCRERYGDDFVKLYDTLRDGIPIGNLLETITFLTMLEEVKQTSDWK